MRSRVRFIDEKTKKSFDYLKNSDIKLYKFISRAFEDIENNAFCGVQISKRLIPKGYLAKLNERNLWKYNLPERGDFFIA